VTGSEIIQAYENILSLTEEMLLAARESDWERLIERERECCRQVQTLASAQVDTRLDPPFQQRKIEIIHKVLAGDAEIRDLTEPRMARLQELLSGTRRERQLISAYGPGASG
jgi:flagellar protein FliT